MVLGGGGYTTLVLFECASVSALTSPQKERRSGMDERDGRHV